MRHFDGRGAGGGVVVEGEQAGFSKRVNHGDDFCTTKDTKVHEGRIKDFTFVFLCGKAVLSLLCV